MAAKDASGIQDCLSRKRMRLVEEGLARPTVRRDVVRIACDLGVPSLTNAARMLTGTNLPGRDLWVRVA